MDVLGRIVGIILPVFLIIAAGYGYARLRGEQVTEDMAGLSRVNVELLSPVLLFSALASKDFDLFANVPLISAGLLISLGSGLIAWPIARLFGYDPRTFVPPMIYNNCGNMGVPLAVLAFGASALSEAIAMFVASTLVYFTIGVWIIESARKGPRLSMRRTLANPMIMSVLLGILFAAFRIPLPTMLLQAMRMLGEASIPVMLIALGVRMVDVSFAHWRIGLIGAIVCPLSGLAAAWGIDHWLALTEVQRGQMYLFASLPPAVFSFMIATAYKQEPDKVAAIVMLGNLAAIVFVPLGLWMGIK
ncbi:MAG: AEC family transporter [Burkholderiaceae bacterium]